MYLLLKGKLANFQHSLMDYLERCSALIGRFPPGTLLWGARQRYTYFREGATVFLYVSREAGFPGGVVLYGTLQRPEELRERYWLEGDWPLLLPIRVEKLASGVVEAPRNPAAWRPVTLSQLAELGVRPLPSPGQKLPEDKAKALQALL